MIAPRRLSCLSLTQRIFRLSHSSIISSLVLHSASRKYTSQPERYELSSAITRSTATPRLRPVISRIRSLSRFQLLGATVKRPPPKS